MNLEKRHQAMLEKHLPKAVIAEAAALCAQAREQQASQRHIARNIPPRRPLEHLMAQACADLDQAASGEPTAWPRFIERAHAEPWLRARVAAARQATHGGTFAEFAAHLHHQRELLPRVRDFAHAALLEVDADGTATLQRIPATRRNASPALIWEPVTRFLLEKKVRPTKVAKIVGAMAGVEAETVRTTWLTGR